VVEFKTVIEWVETIIRNTLLYLLKEQTNYLLLQFWNIKVMLNYPRGFNSYRRLKERLITLSE